MMWNGNFAVDRKYIHLCKSNKHMVRGILDYFLEALVIKLWILC
jgi:hypothetical protein